jgi:predicted enzyme related to lactoylglutathione lyase
MTARPSAVWFEIPALDFERAARFYETILGRFAHSRDTEGNRIGLHAAA